MSVLLALVLLFIGINTLLKLSFWKLWQIILIAVTLGGFVFIIYPYAIVQSQTSISALLADTTIRKNIAVLLTLETLVFIGFSFTRFLQFFAPKSSLFRKFMHFYPGFLIFPAVFYGFTQVVFSFSGV